MFQKGHMDKIYPLSRIRLSNKYPERFEEGQSIFLRQIYFNQAFESAKSELFVKAKPANNARIDAHP